MSCGNYSVSRFHFTTGKPYTCEITSEMNSFRVCQLKFKQNELFRIYFTSLKFKQSPRLKALGI